MTRHLFHPGAICLGGVFDAVDEATRGERLELGEADVPATTGRGDRQTLLLRAGDVVAINYDGNELRLVQVKAAVVRVTKRRARAKSVVSLEPKRIDVRFFADDCDAEEDPDFVSFTTTRVSWVTINSARIVAKAVESALFHVERDGQARISSFSLHVDEFERLREAHSDRETLLQTDKTPDSDSESDAEPADPAKRKRKAQTYWGGERGFAVEIPKVKPRRK